MQPTTLIIKRSLLSATWHGSYRVSWPISRFKLPEVVDGFLQHVLPVEAWSKLLLKDLKGRDKEQYIIPPAILAHRARGDEIFFVAGKVFISEGDSAPFTLSLLTRFTKFDGSAHIIHKLHPEYEGEIASAIPFHLVGIAVPVEIYNFRFALQLFSARFFSMLGLAPVVTQTLLLESDQNECKLVMEFESLKRRNEIPFQRDAFFEKMGVVTDKVFGLNIYRDYMESLG